MFTARKVGPRCSEDSSLSAVLHEVADSESEFESKARESAKRTVTGPVEIFWTWAKPAKGIYSVYLKAAE